MDNDHAQGPADAPLTLLEYGDYQCPSTGRAFGVVERLQLHFAERLRFVFRHFPMVDQHPRAMPAALLAEAAADAGSFWGMHALLLSHQNSLEDPDLSRYAEQFGLPGTGGTRVHYERVDADLAAGRAAGVTRTPAFFVNGVPHEGGFDFGSLVTAIEQAAVQATEKAVEKG
ncbi:DsbA family protein [Dactylosporangium maewongense]|uniref:DsbA family protein n=1 Tax=Dactylosporangium maewongense TaxID=634393 RepID=A0ABN2BGF4_9ACTN